MYYIIHPEMTVGGSDQLAGRFYNACLSELGKQVAFTIVSSEQVARRLEPAIEDAVAFINGLAGTTFPPAIRQLLASFAQVFPVALTRATRFPGHESSSRQSFDIADELAKRGLVEEQIATVAAVFCREMVASMEPTMAPSQMDLFLSYRRDNGETVGRDLHRELLARAQSSFRDLSSVRVGDDAQEKIEKALLVSDAVIFLETPKAYESSWIQKELEIALSLNIPIVWIAMGEVDARKRTVQPAGAPHLIRDAIALDSALTDQALEQAFALVRSSGMRVFDSIHHLKELSKSSKIVLKEESKTGLIFSVAVPRPKRRYPEKPLKHIVQFFGRWPQKADKDLLAQKIESEQKECDAGLLLGPIPAPMPEALFDGLSIDSAEEYVSQIEDLVNTRSVLPGKRGLIISGAFPDPEAGQLLPATVQQSIVDAVHAFARAVFEHSGVVIFGTHPTFVPLIFEMARRKRPHDYKHAVHLYVSRVFEKSPEKYQQFATVFPVSEVAAGDELATRNASLTEMRRKMVNDPQALGVVAIGGKYQRPGIVPGVDEEIKLAREAGLPVFLIGSVPGRAAELAADYRAGGWGIPINGFSPQENEDLMASLDYRTMAEKILTSVMRS